MKPKKLKEFIQKEIQAVSSQYIGTPNTDYLRLAIKQQIKDIINKFAISGPIPHDSVEVTSELNGMMNIKLIIPADMLPPFHSDRCLIGVLDGDWIHSATIYSKPNLLSDLNEKYQTDPIKCFESDLMPSSIKVPFEEFQARTFSYGTVLIHKNGEWFIQDNVNYDQNNMIKLSAYLLFQ